jgi:hypothetical protein
MQASLYSSGEFYSRVHNLNLTRCRNVVDVSALGGVHTLSLNCCENVTDVSALGGVNILHLNGCNVSDDGTND